MDPPLVYLTNITSDSELHGTFRKVYVGMGGIPSVLDRMTVPDQSVIIETYDRVTHRNTLGFLIL